MDSYEIDCDNDVAAESCQMLCNIANELHRLNNILEHGTLQVLTKEVKPYKGVGGISGQ